MNLFSNYLIINEVRFKNNNNKKTFLFQEFFGNNQFSANITRLTRATAPAWLRRFFHSFAPGQNTFCTLQPDEYDFQEFPWRVSYPAPVIKKPNLDWLNFKDPLIQLVKEKQKYQRELNLMKSRHERNKKIKAFKMAFDMGYYSQNVVEFMEKLDQDPDKFFNGRYDYYYTGGTMDIIRQPYFDYLFYATGENMDQIEFQRITTKNKLKKSFEVNLSDGGTIFEVIPASIASNNFAVRQRFKNSIYSYQATNKERSIEKVCEFQSKTPLISSAFDPYNNTTFCDLSVAGEFRSWDIKSNKVILNEIISPIKIENKLSCRGQWGALKNVERDVFLHCERKQINLIDLRKDCRTEMNIFNFQESVSVCEEMSCITKSKINPNLMYIGTYHKLFGIDHRFVKKDNFEMNSIIRWVHQLKSPPLMIKTDNNDQEEEIILIASPLVGDSKICVTSKNDRLQHISKYLPHKPYSIRDSFDEAQIRGFCIDPYSNIKKRTRLCNMGISLICKEDRNLIYTQNSAGDVHRQFFGDKVNLEYGDVSLLMDKWRIETKYETTIQGCATEILNMKSMLIPMMQRTITNKEAESFEGIETVKPRHRPRWKRPVNELHRYKDALASDMLSIWDFPQTTEDDKTLISMDKAQPADKVAEWLNRRPSTDEPRVNLNHSLPTTFEVEDDMENSLQKTFSQPVRTRAAKRKYVKGF